MKNYEAIQKMNPKQMAYTFYLMLKPFIEEYSEEERKAAFAEIEKMLMQEVGNG